MINCKFKGKKRLRLGQRVMGNYGLIGLMLNVMIMIRFILKVRKWYQRLISLLLFMVVLGFRINLNGQ